MLTPLHVSFAIFDVCSPFMSLLIVYMCVQDGDQVREHFKISLVPRLSAISIRMTFDPARKKSGGEIFSRERRYVYVKCTQMYRSPTQ